MTSDVTHGIPLGHHASTGQRMTSFRALTKSQSVSNRVNSIPQKTSLGVSLSWVSRVVEINIHAFDRLLLHSQSLNERLTHS